MVINICDRAMIAGCVSATHIIDKDLIIECGKDLQISGIKKEIKGVDYLNEIPESKVPATKTTKEKNKGFKRSPISELKFRIVPVARTAILPVFLAILVVLAIYFIYQFKSALLSWASINLDQEKSTSVQSEPADLNDERRIDEESISADNQSAPSAGESLVKPTVVDDFSGVDFNNEPLQIKSETETTSPSASGKKVAEIFPEKMGTDIEELPLELPVIEAERDSTEREFKMLSRRLALKLKLSEIERQEADIQEVRLEPKTGKVIGAQPANDSKARKDVQPPQSMAKKLYLPEIERQEADIQLVHLEPKTEKVSDAQPADDSKTGIDVQPQPSAVREPPSQAPPVKSDLDPITKPRQEPDIEVAGLGQVNKEDDLRSRLNLKERLQSFLEVYCRTYEAKDLDHFSTFFTPDAKENGKPFHNLLPKYRHNFDVIEFINYRIELQKYKYDDEHGMVNIEGIFFLEWLPGGTRWRRNSGKIFMELQESGTSYKISRLDYHGGQPKKTR
jgi:hypothetical protein